MCRGTHGEVCPDPQAPPPGSFLSVADLQVRVLAFVDYDNRTMARPFKWTYQGKAPRRLTTELFVPPCTRFC